MLVAGRFARPLSWALSIGVLLGVDVLKGVLTGRPLLRSGLEFAAVALGSAVVGWLVGTLFERTFGIVVPETPAVGRARSRGLPESYGKR